MINYNNANDYILCARPFKINIFNNCKSIFKATIRKITISTVTEEVHTNMPYIISSPIGKILVEPHSVDNTNSENKNMPEHQELCTPTITTAKRILFMSEPMKSGLGKNYKYLILHVTCVELRTTNLVKYIGVNFYILKYLNITLTNLPIFLILK